MSGGLDIGVLTGAVEIDDRLTRPLDELTHKVEGFAEKFLGEFSAIGISVGVVTGILGGLVATITALGVEGSEVVNVTAGFDRLAGSADNAGKILDAMRAGVVGTRTDMALMQDANKLMANGVAASAETFGTLTAASRVLSREGFGPIEAIEQSINRAMQTGQTVRLGRIGLTVDLKTAEDSYAAALGLTKAQLDPLQLLEAKREAILTAAAKAVSAAGVQELSFAERIIAVKVAIQDWVEELEKAIASSPQLGQAFGAISDAIVKAFGGDSKTLLDTVVLWVNKFATAVTEYGPGIIQTFGDIIGTIKTIFHDVEDGWNLLPDWMKEFVKATAVASLAAFAAKEGFDALTGSIRKMGEDVTSGSDGLLSTGANVAQISSQLPKATGALGAFTGALKDYLKESIGLGTSLEGLASAEGAEIAQTEAVAAASAKLAGTVGPIVNAGVAAGVAADAYILYSWGMQLVANKTQDASIKATQLAMDNRNLALASEESGRKITDLAEALEYLKTHHITLTAAIQETATAQQTNAERTKEAQTRINDAKSAIDTYNAAQKTAALGDESSAVAQEKLQVALTYLLEHTKEGTIAELELANAHMTAVTAENLHDTALENLTKKLTLASSYIDISTESISKMSGAQLASAEVYKIELPLIEADIARHIALSDVQKNYLAIHAESIANYNNEQVSMLAVKGITIEYVEALKAKGQTEQQIADGLGVSTANLKKATDGWSAHRQAVLDDSNASLKFTTTDLQQTIKGIKDKYDAQVRGYDDLTVAGKQYIADAAKKRDDDIKAQLIDGAALSKASQQSLQDVATKATTTYDSMTGDALKWSAATKLTFQQTAAVANAAVQGIDPATFAKSQEGLKLTADIAAQKYKDMEGSSLHFSTAAQANIASLKATAAENFTGINQAFQTSLSAQQSTRELADESSHESFLKRASDAKTAYEAMLVHSNDYSDKSKAAITLSYHDTSTELSTWTTTGLDHFHKSEEAAKAVAGAVGTIGTASIKSMAQIDAMSSSLDRAQATADRINSMADNTNTPVLTDRYTRAQITAAAESLHTTSDAINAWAAKAGDQDLSVLVKAGIDAINAQNRIAQITADGLTDRNTGLISELQKQIDHYIAIGGTLSAATVTAVNATQSLTTATQSLTVATASTPTGGMFAGGGGGGVRPTITNTGEGIPEDLFGRGATAASIAAAETAQIARSSPAVWTQSGTTSTPPTPPPPVKVEAGAVVLNYPIMNDPSAMNKIANLFGDALMGKLAGLGWKAPSGIVR